MQVPDTERQTCCRCKRDVTTTIQYKARKPRPAGFDNTEPLYDCGECAIGLVVGALKVSKKNQAFFQNRTKQLALELQNEKAAHQQTQAELNQKATELDGATQQCEAFRLAFRTYSNGLPTKKAKDSFNMLVTKQLASIQQQFAKKQAASCENAAREADLIAAEHTNKACMLRAKAKTVLARWEEQQMLLRKKEEESQQEQSAKANEAPVGESLKKKKKTEQND